MCIFFKNFSCNKGEHYSRITFLVSAVYNEIDIPITRMSFDNNHDKQFKACDVFESSSLQKVLIKQHVKSIANFMTKHVSNERNMSLPILCD